MKKIITNSVIVGSLLAPVFVLATQFAPQNLDLVNIINKIAAWLLSILVASCGVALVYAGFLFVTSQGDEGKVKTARQFVLWALVGLAVGFLAWVLVNFTAVLTGGIM